jgi:hypothetical protein
MAIPSDRENSAPRQSVLRAHAGESSRAYRPAFCSTAVSVPIFSMSFDSGEPRCTSQTVRKM